MTHNNSNEPESVNCNLKGGCSTSPTLSSTHAVILVYLEELAFYLVELDALGASNEKINTDFIELFSEMVSNVEYSQAHLSNAISTLYTDLLQAKDLYTALCSENDIVPSRLKSTIKLPKEFNVTDAIKQGQELFVKSTKKFDENQKQMLEIMLILLKSICIYIAELQGLDINFEEAYKALISMLSIMNFHTFSTKNLEKIIEKYTKLDYILMLKVFEARKEAFGDLQETKVNMSVRPGKAILVSGTNLNELDKILKATQDKGIDVYTHGQMIVAHTYPKLKAYPHLVGHYGKGIEHYLSDFSSFHGAIFLTKLSLHKIENLYRSRVFTSDTIAPMGVITIKNNNFEPLIHSALDARGFTRVEELESLPLGIDEKLFIRKMNQVADKIDKNEIKHVFIVGVPNRTDSQKQYMEEFLDLLGDDCFALSFTHTNNKDNVFYANVDYATPFVYLALNIFISRKSFEKMKSIVLYTRCEPHTFPTVFNMKYMGINEIYFTNCSPNVINPSLTDSIRKMIKLESYSNPKSDFNNMIKKNIP